MEFTQPRVSRARAGVLAATVQALVHNALFLSFAAILLSKFGPRHADADSLESADAKVAQCKQGKSSLTSMMKCSIYPRLTTQHDRRFLLTSRTHIK